MNVFCIYILLKARNRFKRDEIIDICDLAARLYGEWTRPFLGFLLIATNSIFLMAYIMFFGTQTDQLVCKTFKWNDCGYKVLYSSIILIILLPMIYQRRLRNIGIFSAIILIFTFSAIIIIIYLCITIAMKSPEENQNDYGLDITDEDRDYNYWDSLMIPVFCATMMTLFEGN
jgi:amino acid permease